MICMLFIANGRDLVGKPVSFRINGHFIGEEEKAPVAKPVVINKTENDGLNPVNKTR